MNILITGANGFVGGAILKRLRGSASENNRKLFGLIRSEYFSASDDNELVLLKADITDKNFAEALPEIESLDVAVHCAGLAHQFGKVDEKRFFEVNVDGTRKVAEFALKKNVKHFILISSVSVYGEQKEKITHKNGALREISEDQDCNPAGAYAISKFESERAAREIFSSADCRLTILRLATVIGEGDRGNVLRLIKTIERNRFVMLGRGENYKSLIDVEDAAKACEAVILQSGAGREQTEIFNIAGQPVKMKHIVGQIRKNLNKPETKFYMPFFAVRTPLKIISRLTGIKKFSELEKTLDKWRSNEIFSGSKFKDFYAIVPQTAPLKAIEAEVEWYKKQRC